MFTFFSSTTRTALFYFLLLCGVSLSAQQPHVPTQQTVASTTYSVADVGGPILACSNVIPEGGMVIAEYFLTKYEYAYRRVAMLRARGFKHATLMHTDCQPVDVKGDFYYVVVSPVVFNETEAYLKMDDLEVQVTKAGLEFGLLRIVRTQD